MVLVKHAVPWCISVLSKHLWCVVQFVVQVVLSKHLWC